VLDTIERLLGADGTRARSALRASLAAIVPSLLLFALLVALGIDSLRAPRQAIDPAFVLYSVMLAPAIETAVMLAAAAVLARLLPQRALLQIVVLALLAALAHRIGGGWRQVLRTLWPLAVYAGCLVLWLRRSARDAFLVTTLVHMAYNGVLFAVGYAGMLASDDG
jgi:hypothetical protein